MTVTEPGISEVRIERYRFPDGSIDPLCVYRKLRIVGESGAHIVIERISRADIAEMAAIIEECLAAWPI